MSHGFSVDLHKGQPHRYIDLALALGSAVELSRELGLWVDGAPAADAYLATIRYLERVAGEVSA